MKRIVLILALAAGYLINNGLPFKSGDRQVNNLKMVTSPEKLPTLIRVASISKTPVQHPGVGQIIMP